MKKSLFAVLLLCLGSLSLYAQINATKEEYAVYAFAIGEINRESRRQQQIESSFEIRPRLIESSFVILEETLLPPYNPNVDEIRKIKGLGEDFRRKNQTSIRLKKQFPIRFNHKVVSKSEIDELLAVGQVRWNRIDEDEKRSNSEARSCCPSDVIWKPFYERYPKAQGYYQFSRVGFSKRRNFALVQVEKITGSSSGIMNYVLRKEAGNWQLYLAFGGGSVA
jgi:phage pi2 protein 07